jgi:hypothetical protein
VTQQTLELSNAEFSLYDDGDLTISLIKRDWMAVVIDVKEVPKLVAWLTNTVPSQSTSGAEHDA